MDGIAWVLGIGIFVGFVLKWPRKMAVLIGAVLGMVALIGGGIWTHELYSEHSKAKLLTQFELKANYDTEICGTEFPIAVIYTNGSDETVKRVSFRLVGYREGYSSPLYRSGYGAYSSDRIVAPGETGGACWTLPDTEYGTSERVLESNTPDTLTWRIEDFRPTFID